jgi:plastocyanin
MTMKFRMASVVIGALIISVIAVACGEDTTSVIQTQTALNKELNATATTAAIIAQGGDPDQGVQVGEGSRADEFAKAYAATQTAIAEGGGETATPTPETVELVAPEGPALTDADNPTINIADRGVFDPEVILVKTGTTVTWLNGRRSASSSTSNEGEAEQWNSDAFSKGTFDKEPASFSHTFTIPGCHKYKSLFSGDVGEGAICVEE